jgi:hypothetical protein
MTSRLRPRITCPHCWDKFAPEQILWVSSHAELMGDRVLGPEAPSRFLPTRFNVQGQAIDARGMACQTLACPRCHLPIARDLIESDPLFISIIGVPSSGKSYFLASMTWQLRRVLPANFHVTFGDADTVSNRSLNEYEETLFLSDARQELVAIRKTELQGELYDQIRLGQQIMSLPRPFLFTLRPTSSHPRASSSTEVSRVLCLYDNAGEHFQPGMDSASAPVTQHLAKSRVLMFLYDPTQDVRFREKLRTFSQDPQLSSTARAQRQETVLTEAALRVRRHAGLGSAQKLDRPLIVIVAKSDVWAPLVEADLVSEPLVSIPNHQQAMVDVGRIERTSAILRAMMRHYAPEFVAAAEDFCQHVIYIPVSSLGQAPQEDPQTKALGVRPGDIHPRWVTVPILYTFAKWSVGLIGGVAAAPATAQ